MKKFIQLLAGVLIMTVITACSGEETEVAGYIEHVKINGVLLPAKLDTGADICSVDAEIVRTYKDGKKTYVEFNLVTDDGDKVNFTVPRVRVARIRLRTGGIQERPVVMLNISVGNISHDVEVNLADRERFDYRVLLGRNFLKHGILVDSSKQFIIAD